MSSSANNNDTENLEDVETFEEEVEGKEKAEADSDYEEEAEEEDKNEEEDDDDGDQKVAAVSVNGTMLLAGGKEDAGAVRIRYLRDVLKDPSNKTPRKAVADAVRFMKGATTGAGNVSTAMVTLIRAVAEDPEGTLNATFEVQEDIVEAEDVAHQMEPFIEESSEMRREVLGALRGLDFMKGDLNLAEEMATTYRNKVRAIRKKPIVEKYRIGRKGRTVIRKETVAKMAESWPKKAGDGGM